MRVPLLTEEKELFNYYKLQCYITALDTVGSLDKLDDIILGKFDQSAP